MLKERAARVSVVGNRQYNPGWHLAMDLFAMLTVSEAVTRAAIERQGEPRRSHPRGLSEHRPDARGKVNVVVRKGRTARSVSRQEPLPQMPDELRTAVRGGEVSATKEVTMRIWRGTREGGAYVEYTVPIGEGMVVLDVVSSRSKPRRRPTSPSGGTARPASAGRAAPRSTASRG